MINRIKSIFLKNATKKIVGFSEEKEDYLIVFALEGIGDMCYSLAFLDELKERRNKKILLITKKYLSEIASYFKPVDEIIVVSDKQVNVLKHVLKTAYCKRYFNHGDGDSRLYYFTHWESFDFSILRLPQTDYVKIYRYIVYNLDASAKITYPVIEDGEIDKYNYIPFENSAIINPYSNYLSQVNIGIFETIAEYLSLNGVKVYTNIVGDQQPLSYSEGLRCSIGDLYRLSKRVKVLITVRSGIADLVVNSGGNIIAIYPEYCEEDRLFKKAYTLSAWEGDSNIFEFNTEQKNDILLTLNDLFGR